MNFRTTRLERIIRLATSFVDAPSLSRAIDDRGFFGFAEDFIPARSGVVSQRDFSVIKTEKH